MNERYKKFAERYFETLNGQLSAEFAGYSAATARQKAWDLLQLDEVQEYLQKLRAKAEVKAEISRERWLKELAAVGFANIQNYIDPGNEVKDISEIERDQAAAVLSVKKTLKTSGEESTEIRLHDKLSALDKIGRHFNYYEADSSSKPVVNTIVNLGNGTPPENEVTNETE